MTTTFRSTTIVGYFEADQKPTKWQVFEFPNSSTNRIFSLGRGVGILRFKGFAASLSDWNTLRGLFTDGTSGTLQYKASRASGAADHQMVVFARLTDARPLGSGWEYTVEFLAQDQVPKTVPGNTDVY